MITMSRPTAPVDVTACAELFDERLSARAHGSGYASKIAFFPKGLVWIRWSIHKLNKPRWDGLFQKKYKVWRNLDGLTTLMERWIRFMLFLRVVKLRSSTIRSEGRTGDALRCRSPVQT
jgi:hypothetical protein